MARRRKGPSAVFRLAWSGDEPSEWRVVRDAPPDKGLGGTWWWSEDWDGWLVTGLTGSPFALVRRDGQGRWAWSYNPISMFGVIRRLGRTAETAALVMGQGESWAGF